MKPKKFRRLHLGKPRQLTAGLTDHEHPAVSPDGKWIAFYSGPYGAIEIVVCGIDGRFGRSVSPHGGNNTQPAWRPDGGALAYRHQHDSNSKWELWETPLRGEEQAPRQLLGDPRWNYKHPYYSPDGQTLAYFTDEGSDSGAYHIWLWELASGSRCQVTFGDTQMHCHPVFSPDGRRIAFHAYEGTDESRVPAVTNLYELVLESGTVTQLTQGEDQYKHPFYISKDVIVFHHERNVDGLRGLEALHLSSGKIVPLTDGSNNDKHPFPFSIGKKAYLAWSSKHLDADSFAAGELPGQALPEGFPKSYDIFFARLRVDKKLGGKAGRRKKASGRRGRPRSSS